MISKPKNKRHLQPIVHPHQRVGVFIDVQNLYYSAKNLHKRKVNFGNILKVAVAGRQLIRAISYVVRTETQEEMPFFDALFNLGIEKREKDLQIFYNGMKKADWDVGLTIDMIGLAPSLDAVVLVSGDGDYIPLVVYLQKTFGTHVEVMAFGETASAKLVEVANSFTDLSENKELFLINDKQAQDKRIVSKINNRIKPMNKK